MRYIKRFWLEKLHWEIWVLTHVTHKKAPQNNLSSKVQFTNLQKLIITIRLQHYSYSTIYIDIAILKIYIPATHLIFHFEKWKPEKTQTAKKIR